MKTLEELAENEFQKEIKRQLESINISSDLILFIFLFFEKEWQYKKLQNFLGTGITDEAEIEDYVMQLDNELHPEELKEV